MYTLSNNENIIHNDNKIFEMHDQYKHNTSVKCMQIYMGNNMQFIHLDDEYSV